MWEVAVFVLNVLAFILVGLQLKPILARLDRAELVALRSASRRRSAPPSSLARIVWVMGAGGVQPVALPPAPAAPGPQTRWRSPRARRWSAWCGMRGTVTLAAALALPDRRRGGALSLSRSDPLHRVRRRARHAGAAGTDAAPAHAWLRLEDDGSVEREARLARTETARAALDTLTAAGDSSELVQLMRRKYEARLRAVGETADPSGPADDEHAQLAAIQQAIQEAQRRTLHDLRARGTIGDDAFHRVEQELDWGDVNLEGLSRRD